MKHERDDGPTGLFDIHARFMGEALKEAEKAFKKGEAPIGAVIVKEGAVISRGHNTKESKQDATLHAEITAIRKACKKLGSWRLTGCELYVTLEPCAMCAGAILQARLDRLYIGAADPKAGAVGSVVDLLHEDRFNHRVEVLYGIQEDRCSRILKDFFKRLRGK